MNKSVFNLFGLGVLIATKATKLLAIFKVFKFGKVLITLASMLLSVLLYGITLGPWFAVALVSMIFIHEMGHVMALRLKGYEVNGPVFIPFLGAAIFAPKDMDRNTEAFVAYGGPLVGTVAAIAAFGLWFATGMTNEVLLLASYLGLFLNLLNLIPINPFDGGRITQAIGSWFKYIGLAVMAGYTIYMFQPVLLLFWILILSSNRFGLPDWVRPGLATLFYVTMGAAFIAGVDSQPWLWEAVDMFFGGLVVGVIWWEENRRVRDGIDDGGSDVRPDLTWRQRMYWLCFYLGMVALAGSFMALQHDYLPDRVKHEAPIQIQ